MTSRDATGSRISVAVLSYNRRDELRRTLEELQRHRSVWHEIIVGDNASTDGTPEMLRADFPDVRLLETGGNHGIVGSNLAYAAATGDWVLSLDDDSAPVVESMAPVFHALEQRCKAAAIALSVRRTWTPSAVARPASGLTPAFGFSSAGVLFNKRALDTIGTYDPELFLFTNELHWTARAVLAGWELARCDTACVVHRSAPANRSSTRHAFHYTRNLLLFLLRYAPPTEGRQLLTRYLQRVFAHTVLHRSTAYLRAMRDGFRLHRTHPAKRCPLTPSQLAAINPDWRAGFAYFG